ncbi:hypothetical protein IVG45_18390 [Methylomonas sp. LL1]|uniref:hypothetical protein n=1 Tax=Methylomonas sp. LL1 TaxID=2785785 RepID=UPI0018C3B4ED|nr:hypothetical protein [Methylomonas sp. LL1]QPK62778.1 hypothetical protein IVG45_18390 [Methylomonas sp. LL1]
MNKIIVVLALTLTGCSTGIVSTDRDAYMVAHSQPVSLLFPLLSTDSWEKAKVYEEATDFCSGRQRNVETVDLKVRESRFFQRYARAELNFRCVDNIAIR